VSSAEIRYGLGWHKGRGFLREVGAGLVGYITGLPLIGLGMLASMLLMRYFGEPGQGGHPIQDMPIDSPIDILQLYLLASVMAPLVEETMFRGALFHHLRRRFPWIISTLIVTVIFAAIHPQGWVAIPVLGCVAVVLAGIREWRGSLIGSITAHAIHNGAAISLLVLMSR